MRKKLEKMWEETYKILSSKILKQCDKHSGLSSVVGVAGFKPTTSPTPRVRANQAAPYSV